MRGRSGGVVPRVSALIYLYLLAIFGVFLVAAPWTSLWDQAGGALGRSVLARWIGSGYARGLTSGLGVLDLLVAAREADAIWRDHRRARRVLPP
jgi:hypothetical protein